ncbi:hypothetical protein H1D31_06250 [Alishewanella sp. BS5-314]|uniref:hypothetical protein n=1 Tax=Alishewanella sp. BS5-314 TaxID=2755587 RepID=UPI0021BBA9EF|nr:hypothetical protein [Alishewanella sp. BS5-314]MCT8125625.1 hypothetical protein [Alishewanella sp. BS5-314]
MKQAKVLKLSQYKDVYQIPGENGKPFILKRFKGWAKIHCYNNASYTLHALTLLSGTLSSATVPTWAELGEDDVSVRMEFLPGLATGRPVFPADYQFYHRFFSELYQLPSIPEWVKNIRSSQVIPAQILSRIPDTQPMALGFKGDAWQNLLLQEQHLVLADVEDLCLEPLGLSEFVAILDMTTAATSGNFRALSGLFALQQIKPAFANQLTIAQATLVIEMARQIWETRLVHCGSIRKWFKVKIADWLVVKLLAKLRSGAWQ